MFQAWDNQLHGFSASRDFRSQEVSHCQTTSLGKASVITFACSGAESVSALDPFVLPIDSARGGANRVDEQQSTAPFGSTLCEMPDADTVGTLG